MDDMNLSVIVNPGTAVTNFEEFKTAIRRELDEKYSTIEVSEERLRDAKDARAKLNKAKAALKETMRSAQLQNDEILVVPKQQAKELEGILDEYIGNLDSQIKDIEEAQRQDRLRQAKATFAEILATYTEDVQEIAVQCEWIVNPKWGNATYSAAQVKKDCKAACDGIAAALQTFEGEFRPQMIADFIKNGNATSSLLFGKQLQRQKEAYEAAQKAKSAPEPEQIPEGPLVPEEKPLSLLDDVAAEAQEIGKYVIRITATVSQVNWITGLFKAHGIHGSVRKEDF